MLKTLKITSFIAVIAAAAIVLVLVFLGLKGDPEVVALLDSPGIEDRFKDAGGQPGTKEDVASPLVEQARAFALRIDPPPPPPPPKPVKPITPPATARRVPESPKPPVPKVAVTPKSNLLATVVYESSPDKSLALFKAGSKEEWFRIGDRVGNLEINEIRDGSVILTQGGKELPEQFVPSKPQVKSILKDSGSTSPVSQPTTSPAIPGSESITNELPSQLRVPAASSSVQPQQSSPVRPKTGGTTGVGSTGDRTSQSVPNSSGRIRRIRTVPKAPSPAEQKQSIESTLSGIEDIMNREDESLSSDERAREKELWQSLLESLKAEKEALNSQDNVPPNETPSDAKEENPDTPKTPQNKESRSRQTN